MRLTFVISSLQMGGAERAGSLLCNHWAQHGHTVQVLTFDSPGSTPFFPLEAAIGLTHLDLLCYSSSLRESVANTLWRNSVLRRAIQRSRPDVVVSFLDTTNVRTLMATAGLGIPVVVSERTDPSLHYIGRTWSFLRALAYPFAAAVVTQTRAALLALPGPARRRGVVIGNVVRQPQPGALGTEPILQRPTILSVGRLNRGKGYFTLLEAFASLSVTRPDWHLALVGDGEARPELESRTQALGLAGRVHFMGATNQVSRLLRQADVFVLASRYEGFPNALCEALAHGVPAVATDTVGAREVLRHEENGLLTPVGNAGALAQALSRLTDDEALRKRLGARGPDILERFSVEQVSAQWEELLRQVAGHPR
jgi:glycosyltransferase involved in cell wall biosynthesis